MAQKIKRRDNIITFVILIIAIISAIVIHSYKKRKMSINPRYTIGVVYELGSGGGKSQGNYKYKFYVNAKEYDGSSTQSYRFKKRKKDKVIVKFSLDDPSWNTSYPEYIIEFKGEVTTLPDQGWKNNVPDEYITE